MKNKTFFLGLLAVLCALVLAAALSSFYDYDIWKKEEVKRPPKPNPMTDSQKDINKANSPSDMMGNREIYTTNKNKPGAANPLEEYAEAFEIMEYLVKAENNFHAKAKRYTRDYRELNVKLPNISTLGMDDRSTDIYSADNYVYRITDRSADAARMGLEHDTYHFEFFYNGEKYCVAHNEENTAKCTGLGGKNPQKHYWWPDGASYRLDDNFPEGAVYSAAMGTSPEKI